jgi:Bacterial nucleoid DNA-binding protein
VGFGTFSKVRRKARKGRNPRTGEEIKIKATNVVKFKAGKNLREAI